MSETLKIETYYQAVLRAGRVGAFAPGDYMSRCLKCDITFYGDKRAINCLPCAIDALRSHPHVAQTDSLTGDELKDQNDE